MLPTKRNPHEAVPNQTPDDRLPLTGRWVRVKFAEKCERLCTSEKTHGASSAPPTRTTAAQVPNTGEGRMSPNTINALLQAKRIWRTLNLSCRAMRDVKFQNIFNPIHFINVRADADEAQLRGEPLRCHVIRAD